ncbi:HAMP domain-containing sensor histidine kinase [Pseudobacillus wudalianchiensis]|uniref:histidine kinase n=1 Tax=Pseudobacillus wudalianchiensis TaxID=1743143 RepID=A0A1B9B6W4_9BACI|nr:HAMP domain-containing sensor histidine kinase [Bacillus wudalianchiensis]OCA91772.1 two-component sensor histidine kinase [Bacillus wudalianchiensis]
MKTTRRISLLRYWTTRYVAALCLGLFIAAILTVIWLQHTMLNNRLEVSEFIAEELANRIAGSQEEKNVSPTIDEDMLKSRELFLQSEHPPAIFITDPKGRVLSANQSTSGIETSSFAPSLLQKKGDVLKLSPEMANGSRTWMIKKPIKVDDIIFGWVVMLQPENELENVTEEYRLLTGLIISLGLFGWAAIYILSRRLATPISQVAKAAKQIQEGNYQVRLPEQIKEQEVYDLVHSFKEMAQKLQQLESLRAELLAGVTHELKTPVTSISGLLQAVRDGVVTGEEAHNFIDISLKETTKMQKMVNDLLEFNSFSANALPVAVEKHSVNELLSEIVHQWHLGQETEEITISFSPLPTNRSITTDAVRLQQIIVNLLNNARHAVDSDGKIEISLSEQESGFLSIEVKDNGSGIPPAEQALIFERFYRGEQKKYKVRGLGLGLPYSKLLAQALNGELLLKDSSSFGTIFQILLPLAEERIK